jgi:5-methylcytosine-specific restriction endonuclease McrA
MSKKFSESVWKEVSLLVNAGWDTSSICARFEGMTPAQVNYRKRKWASEAKYKSTSKYHTPEYRAWRSAVYKKDNGKCRWCGRKGRNAHLEADHIKPSSTFPHLIHDVSNGRLLCRRCHRLTPTYGKLALRYRP